MFNWDLPSQQSTMLGGRGRRKNGTTDMKCPIFVWPKSAVPWDSYMDVTWFSKKDSWTTVSAETDSGPLPSCRICLSVTWFLLPLLPPPTHSLGCICFSLCGIRVQTADLVLRTNSKRSRVLTLCGLWHENTGITVRLGHHSGILPNTPHSQNSILL